MRILKFVGIATLVILGTASHSCATLTKDEAIEMIEPQIEAINTKITSAIDPVLDLFKANGDLCGADGKIKADLLNGNDLKPEIENGLENVLEMMDANNLP